MSTVSLLNLVNEINLLFDDYKNIEDAFFCLSGVSGYKNVHDAPESVQDAESDISYLDSTLNMIENLFGATNHSFELPDTEYILSLHAITIPLETHLRNLHTVLQTWPNPPTVQATEIFDEIHSHAVRDVSTRIRESQLQLAVWLGDSWLLPAPLHAGLEASPNEQVNNKETEREVLEVWENQLLTIPPTLRLSHLVQRLEELILAMSMPHLPHLAGFSEDVKQIKDIVKMVDQRLLVENHFAIDIRHEIHRMIDVEVKLLLHELKVLPPLSHLSLQRDSYLPSTFEYRDIALHHFLVDHQVIFGMVLMFLAGNRETAGKEEHELALSRNEKREEVEIIRDDLSQDAIAAVFKKIALHSGATNSWYEVQKSTTR
ncbi:hypothetical protein BP6252_13048 [Coleophoma cylindrospora]|uniref:Uncharacterized protein n=1 Tax=Coleophoma cylindrospora TaxID=1849047 RepID=A0A3D8QE24_9HELO|nr:hypothetical protein BP6252_13048 [Coleophoma cylindrospora]